MPVRMIFFIFLLTCYTSSIQARVYKWVDKKGQVHFSDNIPVEYIKNKHEELNQQGGIIKQFPAAETPAQKQQRIRRQAEQEKARLIERKKQLRDRVLLDTYTTERDLILARDARMDAINSQIRLAESIIKDSSTKIKALNQQIKNIKKSGRVVPKDYFRRLANEKQTVQLHTTVAAEDKKRRQQIEQQFSDYLKRFRALKVQQNSLRKALLKEKGL